MLPESPPITIIVYSAYVKSPHAHCHQTAGSMKVFVALMLVTLDSVELRVPLGQVSLEVVEVLGLDTR